MESPETDRDKYTQLILDKETKEINRERVIVSANGTGTTFTYKEKKGKEKIKRKEKKKMKMKHDTHLTSFPQINSMDHRPQCKMQNCRTPRR